MVDRRLARRASAASCWVLAACLIAAGAARAGQGRYMEVEEFLSAAFPAVKPKPAAVWIDETLRARVEALVGHEFGALRVRYWTGEGTTAWIFDEIGKEQPITIGVAVSGGSVDIVRVLEFRETRGWEVRHPFFTDQFSGVRADGRGKLNRSIDGITGATLSVAAVTRAVRLALFMTELTEHADS